ncbi:hypothetical protein PTSG_02135 [Salpingoeca rosetta]|uniref:Uncharacterized protein n=1 Tax=Salpingoeca rosetta (strain ATCC 50818 / BSB-021) TaxID=946362 RepID=F2U1B1_SALR5|nr:uncharacterized protein PTSG_02135 [Salpingoeca rosetta]EGD81413.1 hypothetical protein PTSG_02135 [Salpingoeca rosetta]|eukprot:XP_004996617.1 hypothetical protein PTSG_02135 [Salpingoeca rosetta]
MADDHRAFRARRLSFFHEHARARTAADDDSRAGGSGDAEDTDGDDTAHSMASFDRKTHTEQQRYWLRSLTRWDLDGLSVMIRKDPSLIATTDLYTGSCALHYAARRGDLELLQVLLQGDYQAALHVQNFAGNTPLHVAYANNINGKNSAIVEHLKVIGASEDIQNHAGLTPADMEQKAYAESKLLPLVQLERQKKKEARVKPKLFQPPDTTESPLQRRLTLRESVGALFRGRRGTAGTKDRPSGSFRRRTKTASAASSSAMLATSPAPAHTSAGALFSPPPGSSPFKFPNRSHTLTSISSNPQTPSTPRSASAGSVQGFFQRVASSRKSKAKFG